jgi:hypothetical protein
VSQIRFISIYNTKENFNTTEALNIPNDYKWDWNFTYWQILLITLIPQLLLYSKLQNGISLSSDSLTYLFAARGLLIQGELTYLYGESNLTVFPPLYPFLLALVQLFAPSGDIGSCFYKYCCHSDMCNHQLLYYKKSFR